MLKKSIFYILLFVMLVMIGDYGISRSIANQIDNKSPYYLAFASIGANYLESRLDCWATIEMKSSPNQLKRYLAQILYCLDLPADENKYLFTTDGDSISLNYQTKNENLKGYFCLETDQQKQATYIVVSLAGNDKDFKISGYEDDLDNFPGVKWKYYYLYTGSLDYMVGKESHKELLEVIAKRLKTQNNEIYAGENSTSIAGFSPLLKGHGPESALKNKTYNVQIAIRNNFDENKTYIYIGSPLILGDY